MSGRNESTIDCLIDLILTGGTIGTSVGRIAFANTFGGSSSRIKGKTVSVSTTIVGTDGATINHIRGASRSSAAAKLGGIATTITIAASDGRG